MVNPDGEAPSRMVNVSASVNLPLHHKAQKFSSGTGSPRWSRKRAVKRLWCGGGVVVNSLSVMSLDDDLCVKDDSEGDDFEPADGDLDDEDEDEEAGESEEGVCRYLPSLSCLFLIGSRPNDHYFRSVCLLVCLFVRSFSQPSVIRF